MRIVTLYHPKSDHARAVDEFIREYKNRTSVDVESLSLETQQGADMAKLYGIVSYPAILIIREGSELLMHWEGGILPLISEVQAYASS